MTRARSIAVAQTIPICGDVHENVEHHVRLVHAAAEERAQVLVIPELSYLKRIMNRRLQQ